MWFNLMGLYVFVKLFSLGRIGKFGEENNSGHGTPPELSEQAVTTY
jgi:hypothetical protein